MSPGDVGKRRGEVDLASPHHAASVSLRAGPAMEPASKWEAVGKRLVLTKTGFASVEMRRKDKDTDPVGGGFLLKGV